MLRDYFCPELKENQRPIIAQCNEIEMAMIYCTDILPQVPSDKRYDMAMIIATFANAYAFMNNLHKVYIKEFGQTQGPAKHQ